MVPHGVIEEARTITADEQVFAVTMAERKGEKLVVLHTLDDATVDLREPVSQPVHPRRENFIKIDDTARASST